MPPTRSSRPTRPARKHDGRPVRGSAPREVRPSRQVEPTGPARPHSEPYAVNSDPALTLIGSYKSEPVKPPRESGNRPGNHPHPSRPRPSDRPAPDMAPVTVTIDRIVGDGKGIGFVDGQTVFVARTAPGDVVRAHVTRKQGKVLHAEIEEIITPSPIRIEPRVAEFEASGGLDLQHIAYADQLKVKASIIEDSLRRIARLDPVPEIEVVASPQEWGYRSRAEFQIDHERKAVGYYAAQSHRVIDVEESPVLTPTVQMLLTTLRDDVLAGLVPVTAREYRAVEADGGSVLEPTATPRSKPLFQTVGNERYRFSAECFFQANIAIAEKITRHVIRIAEEAKLAQGYALDLYCGVGLFTVPLARRFKKTVGVEGFATAAKFAESNLTDADVKGARIVTSNVERWLAGDRTPLGRVALAVFDPPRTGAGPAVIESLLKMKPAHIAAVSCDPATFARDLRILIDGGYEVVDVVGYDMFPQTHHVEIVGHLRRKDVEAG